MEASAGEAWNIRCHQMARRIRELSDREAWNIRWRGGIRWRGLDRVMGAIDGEAWNIRCRGVEHLMQSDGEAYNRAIR
jgi:hypothetical protein